MGKSVLFDIEEGPVLVGNRYVPDKKAIINTQTGRVLGVVSTSYRPIPNRVVLDHFCTILDKSHIAYALGDTHLVNGGVRTAIGIDLPAENVTFKEGDIVSMKIYLLNSFDGRSSAKLIFVFVRLVCVNGMTIGQEIIVSYAHIGKVNEKIVHEFILAVSQRRKALISYVDRLQTLVFPDLQSMEKIIQESAWLATRYRDVLLREIRKAPVFNAWWLYNAFTHLISHIVRQNIFARLQLMKKLNEEAERWKTGLTEI